MYLDFPTKICTRPSPDLPSSQSQAVGVAGGAAGVLVCLAALCSGSSLQHPHPSVSQVQAGLITPSWGSLAGAGNVSEDPKLS